MVETGDDETSEGPPPRPSAPKRKRESVVIEGRASEADAPGAPAAAPEGAREPLAMGAIGGVIGAALALAGVWLFAARPDLAPLARRAAAVEASVDAANARLSALETQSKAAAAERQALADKLKTVDAALSDAEAKLAGRVAALEAAGDKAATERKAGADSAADLRSSIDALSRDLAAERDKAAADRKSLADEVSQLKGASTGAEALEKRLDALENAVLRSDSLAPVAADARAAKDAADRALAAAAEPKANPRLDRLASDQAEFARKLAADNAEIAALRERLDKFAAPKAETRVSPSAATVSADTRPAARAVAAMALLRRFEAGEPVGAELAALDRLGAEASALAPLRPFAETGAPTPAALARSLMGLAPALPGGAHSAPSGGVARRLLGEMQGLVKIRKVGESRADDATGALSRIGDALDAGDLPRALSAFAELPPAVQAAAAAWRASVEARLAAGKAAEALVGRSVADLGARR